MPPTNERISDLVRKEIAKNPNVGNDVLLEKASAVDQAVRRLSPRQFHATYRLPALRAAKNAQATKSTRPSAAPSPRAATRREAEKLPESRGAAEVIGSDLTPASTSAATPVSAAHRPAVSAHAASAASPYAAEREVVRQVLQTVAREALQSDDRASFVRLLDSLDGRAAMILRVFRP